MDLLKNQTVMTDNPMVSIVCNTFNHVNFIEKTLNGFLNQIVNFNVEILIHDDCSSDGTVDILKKYQSTFPNLISVVFEEENQYSKGVDILKKQSFRVKGKYVAICEGDDFWTDNTKLQSQFDALEKTNCCLCVHKVKKYNPFSGKILGFLPSEDITDSIMDSASFLNILIDKYSFQTSSYFLDSFHFKLLYKENPKFLRLFSVGDIPILLYFLTFSDVVYFNKVMSIYNYGNNGSWSSKYSGLSRNQLANHKKMCYLAFKEYDRYSKYAFHKILKKKLSEYRWAYFYLSKKYFSLFLFYPVSFLALAKNKIIKKRR